MSPSPLASLPPAELEALARALESGRLAAPFARLSLARYVSGASAPGVVAALAELARAGASGPALALFLRHVSEARAHGEGAPVELVCTGPDPEGVPTRETAAVVRELFHAARERVTVVGYAVAQGHEVFRVLATRLDAEPGLAARLYLDVRPAAGGARDGGDALRAFARRFRERDWPGARLPELYHDPRSLAAAAPRRSSLHAKCVVVDGAAALVSSANFTAAAHERNIEVGLLVRSAEIALRIEEHFARLVRSGALRPVPAE